MALASDADRIIRQACRAFARAADWRHVSGPAPHGESRAGIDPELVYQLCENHEGLHCGRYISVSVLPAVSAVAIKGGYYDRYLQPKTVYRESIPLKNVTKRVLGSLLKQAQVRLRAAYRPRKM